MVAFIFPALTRFIYMRLEHPRLQHPIATFRFQRSPDLPAVPVSKAKFPSQSKRAQLLERNDKVSVKWLSISAPATSTGSWAFMIQQQH